MAGTNNERMEKYVEDSIDYIARKGRLDNQEKFKKPDSSPEGRIEHSTSLGRYYSDTKEIGEDFKRRYESGVKSRSR